MADQPAGSEEQPNTAAEEVQQIPAVIQSEQSQAVTDARDKLLQAIGQEAQLVTDKSAGQASAALVELARAYALVATRGIYGTLLGGTVETSNVDQSPALLAVIGKEAQVVADKSAGQASAALVELARAYALVVSGPTAVMSGVPLSATPQSRAFNYYIDYVASGTTGNITPAPLR